MSELSSQDAKALGVGPRGRYAARIDQIVEAKDRLEEIALDHLAGESRHSKQSAILQAARQRNLQINTTGRKSEYCARA